ncbi:MAG: Hpt domain-containing protein [Sphingomicrobium sp.]
MWDDPRFGELSEKFRLRAAGEAAELRLALQQRDVPRVRSLAHSLAGAAGTFGFQAISDLALPLDEAAGEGVDFDQMQRLAKPLLDAVDALDRLSR